ncbi:Sensory box histidine kinase/response regulator [Olavius sp. associated proteobacterium Delta 1]|nr:Sensory box histidine kinase/response regulator [Olavius sp. associated proteobacterium Delta 1]
MTHKKDFKNTIMDSMVITGIGLACFYWVCESFMYFFLEPEANFFQYLLGPDIFQIWTRVLVLCLFAIFGSHVQYTFSKRKAADDALRKSEEKYRTILESIEEGYFETDLAGNLTFFSNPFCIILGYSRSQLIGMNTRQYTTPETADKMDRITEQLLQSGMPKNVTSYDVIRPAGNKVLLELSFSILKDPADGPIGFKGVLRDVSVRKKTEKEKHKLETHLQQAQKMESIGTLAGGIAHDFNNILMGIQGNASLMLLKIDSEHPNHEKIKNIETYVQNGTTLTKQLLGFARRGKYLVKATDLNEIIDKSSSLFARTRKEIQVHTNLYESIWTAEVDRGQIEQVLLNMYVNAWQAMLDGGDLYLSTENVTLDRSYVKPYKVEPGRYVKISISDTGVGIDKETQDRIFEPFFTTKEMGRGTGLGLASVYGIIKSHGGYINVYSELDQGTTFTIYLPASGKEAVEDAELTANIIKGSGTILLIDDEKMILEVGRELLEELGYTVLPAMSGQEAIDIFQKDQNNVDMIIMDMIMPGMSGSETFDRLRKINPDVKILLSSGYSVNGQATNILQRGCDGFIQKPFNMNQLAERILKIMPSQAQRIEK